MLIRRNMLLLSKKLGIKLLFYGTNADLKKNKPGALTTIIDEVTTQFDFSKDSINRNTMRARVARQSLAPQGRGAPALLSEVEPILVRFFVQRENVNKPLTCTEGLQFANSLIKGSPIAEVVKKLKWQGDLLMRTPLMIKNTYLVLDGGDHSLNAIKINSI